MSEKKNIGKEVTAICTKLGLEPPFVKSLHLTPTTVEAVIYLRDDKGDKYVTSTEVTDDTITTTGFGVPATTTKTFEVRT